MAQENENGGCFKMIIGFILCVVIGAFVYFILSPLVMTLVPILLVGFLILVVVGGILTFK